MTKRLLPALLAAGFIGTIAASPARADLTVTWHMTMDGPMMKNLPDQYRGMMDTMMNPMVLSTSGKLSRTDMPMMTVIVDKDAQKMTMINKYSKTYWISAIDPNKGPQMPGGPMGGNPGAPTDIVVTETGKSKVILGHKCHELVVTGKFAQQQGQNMSFKDDLWAASDLGLGSAASSIPYGGFGSAASKIDGFPLQMTVSMTGGQADGMIIDIETTNISTDTLPPSTFQVPDGYTKTDNPSMGMGMPGGRPGMGGPGMGGGGGFPPGMGGGVPPTQ